MKIRTAATLLATVLAAFSAAEAAETPNTIDWEY